MNTLAFSSAMTLAIGTGSLADGLYWVVGNRAAEKCDIVASNRLYICTVAAMSGSGTAPINRSLRPSSPARPLAPARSRIQPPTEARSVQRVAAALEGPAQGHRRVELLQFGFQSLVDQQQRFQ